MKLLTLLVASYFFITAIPIYNYQFDTYNSGVINFSNFQGKKMLLVNIASQNSRISQLAELKQLQQQFGDSLIIIAFPSNSFSNEPLADSAINALCSSYQVNFPIAMKSDVRGSTVNSLYAWLADEAKNGSISIPCKSDFQKYIIDKNGNIKAVFAGSVSPLSSEVISAISSN